MTINKNEALLTKEQPIKNLNGDLNSVVSCGTGANPNCSECCTIFSDATKRARFGYQLESVACECHDICVQDVKDICVKRRTFSTTIPCRPDGSTGCRGGFLPDGAPTIRSWRVLCAEECLSPTSDCDRIRNEIEFEIVLNYGENHFGVITPKDSFDCLFHEFARFPSGILYPNNTTGFGQWRNELAFIDGSCKVIIIENVFIRTEGNNCVLVIEYKVIDKLWKHENLLVSALRPYWQDDEGTGLRNITIKKEFEQGHQIGPCANGPCF
ncbi:MAG: hypothetical protein PHS83_01860 [Clostridia bacterium]|jgi:hypothetical protein|nr:hypothetical protein [Clostridia bacterium]MDD4145833.1 hypothetical protein [Clostridia bacterium]MDD4665124.1 hypothetical protein [Clostridia bacterium]